MIVDKLLSINELTFFEAVKIINEVCDKNIKLSSVEIKFILNANEKELVNIFFEKYKNFKQEDFILIEDFINNNLEIENKDFLSDLIYFATDFGLNVSYKKIIDFLLINEEDTDCLVLACLKYISMNLKFLYINELIENLEFVRNNILYHQNEQVLASLILYRITNKIEYLDFIQELIDYSKSNLEFLNNILKEEMYSEHNFNYSDFNTKIKR